MVNFLKTVFILLLIYPTVGKAQDSDKWKISVNPDMPDLTTIKPNETGNRIIPFLSKVQTVWDESLSGLPYNAFTDLIRYKDNWYCTFREGISHVKGTGKVRVLKSGDARSWRSVALFEIESCDLRDPKFSITPEGKLMVNSLILFISYEVRPRLCQSITWLSSDGENWSDVYACTSGVNTWRWAVTWHNGIGYSVAYWSKDVNGTLYTTSDGKMWSVLAEDIFPMGKGNEASLEFGPDNTAYCLLRDGPGGMAHLGISHSPYKDWTWTDLGMYAGGPELIRLRDGRLLAVVRLHEGGLPPSETMPGLSSNLGGGRTSLCWIDPDMGMMEEFLTLPSGGHGGHSYAGIVEHDGLIWISYYSSHENQTEEERPFIYLAKVKLDQIASGADIISFGAARGKTGQRKTEAENPSSATIRVRSDKRKSVTGNISYKSVRIGEQEWMSENLDLSHFRNGDPIPEARDAKEWQKAGREGKPAWCYYDNNPENGKKYGRLYNWYAVNDPRGLVPEGWKIPAKDEWTNLIDFSGGGKVAAVQLKAASGWKDSTDGSNETGFSGLPGGYRHYEGGFNRLDEAGGGYWWSAEQGFVIISGSWPVYLSKGGGYRYFTSKGRGFSVRCIKE